MDNKPALMTTASLRRGLTTDLSELRSGHLRPAEARTRAYVAKQIIDTLKLEVVAENMRLDTFRPIALGVD